MKNSLSFKSKMLIIIVVIFTTVVFALIGTYIYLNNKYISEEIEALSGATITPEQIHEIRARSYRSLSFIFILGIILIIILGNAFSNKIVEVLDKLKEDMYLAGSGDLTPRLEIKSNDEIGDLYAYFNVMVNRQTEVVHSLKDSVQTLSHISEEVASSSEEVGVAIEEIAINMDDVAKDSEEGIESVVEVSQVLLELSSLIQMSKELALSTEENS